MIEENTNTTAVLVEQTGEFIIEIIKKSEILALGCDDLGNTWNEVCVQVQETKTPLWSLYEDYILNEISEYFKNHLDIKSTIDEKNNSILNHNDSSTNEKNNRDGEALYWTVHINDPALLVQDSYNFQPTQDLIFSYIIQSAMEHEIERL